MYLVRVYAYKKWILADTIDIHTLQDQSCYGV